MIVKSGSVWNGLFVTVDATGALATPSAGPTGKLYVDGVANSATVTITGSNPYKFSVTLPSLTAGQHVDMYITATISSIATAGIVASAQADTVLLSDGVMLADDAITAAKFDESTAFPLKAADTGSTQVARTGADGDTLETLSDEIATVQADLDNPDQYKADVSGIPAAVWGYATRTLSSFGTLISDIWSHATRTLSAFGFTVATQSDANVTAIKAKTDNLPATPANEATLTAIKGDGWTDETLVALMTAIENISAGSGASAQEVWGYANRTLTDASGLGLATAASQNLISNDLNAMPGKVWNHPTRTLTQSGSTVEYPAEGDPLVIYRDTTVAISLVNLGNVTGADKMWFTVKDNVEDVDSKSIIQIDTNGLQYINGVPAGSAVVDGGIVINDPTLGNISIFLKQEQAARLPLYEAYPTRWDVKVLKDGIVTILNIGSMYIKGTPTRAIL